MTQYVVMSNQKFNYIGFDKVIVLNHAAFSYVDALCLNEISHLETITDY